MTPTTGDVISVSGTSFTPCWSGVETLSAARRIFLLNTAVR